MVIRTMTATAASTRSIDLVRRFNDEVFTGRDYDRVADMQAGDYVQHGPMAGMELHGLEESVETMRMFHAAFSDLEGIEQFAFGDEAGEYVCTAYAYRGTHDGDFMGIPQRTSRPWSTGSTFTVSRTGRPPNRGSRPTSSTSFSRSVSSRRWTTSRPSASSTVKL